MPETGDGGVPVGGHRCPECGHAFTLRGELARHVQSAHAPSPATSGVAGVPAPRCRTTVAPHVGTDSRIESRQLWVDGCPGRDLRPGTREYRLFTSGLPEFLASLGPPAPVLELSPLYDHVSINAVMWPYFFLFDQNDYRLIRLNYAYNRVDIAYGLYHEVLDTQDDAQFFMLLLAQLLELHSPGVTKPDSTTAALVRDENLRMHGATRGLLATQCRYVERQLRERKIEEALRGWLSTSALSESDRECLEADRLSNLDTATLCGLTHANVASIVDRRLKLLSGVYEPIQSLLHMRLHISDSLLGQLWDVHIPVSEWIISRAGARERTHPGEAYVVGLSGVQGSGKSTIHEILRLLLTSQGYQTAGLSLDDIYRTHEDRQSLKRECPYFRFRGPPGTHDVDLGISTIESLRHSQPDGVVRIPAFDKSLHDGDGDRLAGEQWRSVGGRVRIVILDGWCLGAQAVGEGALDVPVNAIEASRTYDDERGTFRRRIDRELRHYEGLFGQCDDVIVLDVPNLGNIYRWRELQEAKLRAATGRGMDPATVRVFVDYFLPVTERYMVPLAQDPAKGASLVLSVGDDHRIRRIKRFEREVTTPGSRGYLTVDGEEAIKATFRHPERSAQRERGTVVVIADGVGVAPLDRDNPLFYCATPHLDLLASPIWSRALGFSEGCADSGTRRVESRMPRFLQGARVLGTTIHASSEELGLKRGQPGDSSVGHASLGMGGYRRRYIGLIWDAIANGTFGTNEAVRRPIEHVIQERTRYAHPKLHIWGMCSRGYIHSDIDVLFEILTLCGRAGLRREEVIVHVVTDGKDVPKDTAAEYVRELEETMARLGVGVIGTICGRDGWMCNRDRAFLRARNAPAAQCIIAGRGVLPDAPGALAAIGQAKAGEAGKKYGEDIDRFLPPTHIQGVYSCVESGDAMICFNLREDRSVLFPQAFIFPIVDRGELSDFLYATLIELRTLKTHSAYQLEGFRQKEGGERVPLSLVRAGFVVRTFAESEKGQEVSNTYLGSHAATIKKHLGAVSSLLDIDPDRYPTTPSHPAEAPEMKADEVTDMVEGAMGDGVAVLANLCNGDVIGHYSRKELTRASMKVVDRQIGCILAEARERNCIALITADHGCVETWGPMHSANRVPFFAVFPPRYRAWAEGLVVGVGIKALTDVEPTRLMLLGIPQDEHITGDSILIPDVSAWSDKELIHELLRQAAMNQFALLRRCPDGGRMRRVLEVLGRHPDRQVVQMFLLRLRMRLRQLTEAACPFISEFTERFSADFAGAATLVEWDNDKRAIPVRAARSRRDEWSVALIPPVLRGAARVVGTTAGRSRVLVSADALRDVPPDRVRKIGEALNGTAAGGVMIQGTRLDCLEEETRLAAALKASHLIVGTRSEVGRRRRVTKDAAVERLAAAAGLAKEHQVRLLIENEGSGDAAPWAKMTVIRRILTLGAPFGLLLNVDHAVPMSRSRDCGDMAELWTFLSDRVVRSHIEAVRVIDDDLSHRVVRYFEEQGLDVAIVPEGRVVAEAVADARDIEMKAPPSYAPSPLALPKDRCDVEGA